MFDWQPVWLSLKVATFALAIVFLCGTGAAHWLSGRRFPGKDLLEGLFLLPLVLPPVVTGYVLLLLLGRRGPLGYWLDHLFGIRLVFTVSAAVIASAIVAFPLMYQSAKTGFMAIDTHMLDVARSLGASPRRAFFTIALALARPALVAGAVLSFARAFGEFGATIMVAGNIPGQTTTVPLAIYMATEGGDFKGAGIYAALTSVFTLAFIVALNWWMRRLQVTRPHQ